ncbi:MAG: hypothetical protein AB7G40_07385 [Hyphomonadaceae bacterium]
MSVPENELRIEYLRGKADALDAEYSSNKSVASVIVFAAATVSSLPMGPWMLMLSTYSAIEVWAGLLRKRRLERELADIRDELRLLEGLSEPADRRHRPNVR